MEIRVTQEALEWFKEEMDVRPGDSIRFYARYGGSNPFHEGFSIGMNREQPITIGVENVLNDILFFIEEKDLWFFNEHNLIVEVDQALDELKYRYEQ